MKTAIIWIALAIVPVFGSLFDYHKNEKPKTKHKISKEISVSDTLNIKNERKNRKYR
tara:strand:- start:2813 stop:2983 length:171 start_codon:yes stop_codon:yes gene_type:complete